VTELAPVPHRAAIETAVEDDAPADARRDREVDHVAGAGAGAVAMLAGGRRGRVVLEGRRPFVRLLDERRDRDVVPVGQVRRRHEQAARRVERPAGADPDRGDLGPGETRLGDRAAAELEQAVDPVRRAFLGEGRLDEERQHAALAVDDAGSELRPTDV
jgi:hypothetical protein